MGLVKTEKLEQEKRHSQQKRGEPGSEVGGKIPGQNAVAIHKTVGWFEGLKNFIGVVEVVGNHDAGEAKNESKSDEVG